MTKKALGEATKASEAFTRSTPVLCILSPDIKLIIEKYLIQECALVIIKKEPQVNYSQRVFIISSKKENSWKLLDYMLVVVQIKLR